MNRYKDTHYKSTTQFYNTAVQNVLATNLVGNPLTLNLGGEVTDTGCAINFQQTLIDIESRGLYDVDIDLIVEGVTAGDVTLAITNNGVILPETVRTLNVVATVAEVITLGTVRLFNVCCGADTNLRVIAYSDGTGVANVNLVSGSVVKLA